MCKIQFRFEYRPIKRQSFRIWIDFFSDPFISGITQELADMEKRHTADIETNQALRAEKDAKKAEKKLSELYDADDDEDDD